MKDTRTEQHDTGGRRASTRGECIVQGCKNTTTEHKSYCIDHIDQSPHAKSICEYIEEREAEERAAARRNGWQRIDVNGSRAREIVDYLTIHGAQSPKRLATLIEMPPAILDAYLTAMERAQMVKKLRVGSRRGTPRDVVTLWAA